MLQKVGFFLAILSLLSLPQLVQAGASNTSATVVIKNSQFSPSRVQIVAGSTVTWVNQDSISHTTTSDSTATAEPWDSRTLQPGESFTKTFTQVGTYTYHCTLHPEMKGTVQVVARDSDVAPVVTSELPATGLPVGLYFLIGLLPAGLKLIKFKKESKEESAQNLWDGRQYKI